MRWALGHILAPLLMLFSALAVGLIALDPKSPTAFLAAAGLLVVLASFLLAAYRESRRPLRR